MSFKNKIVLTSCVGFGEIGEIVFDIVSILFVSLDDAVAGVGFNDSAYFTTSMEKAASSNAS